MPKKTAALLIGFGGPASPGEVKPFLDSVLEGIRISQTRYEEVLHHYDVIGGTSPYNAFTFKQKEALERWFRSQNIELGVGVGFRHSTPALKDAFETFKKFGVEKVVGFTLASFQSDASFEKYRAKVEQARTTAGADGIELIYTDTFDQDPRYLGAQADLVKEKMTLLSEMELKRTFFLFSAHSIPVVMCEKSAATQAAKCYGWQFTLACRHIANLLGLAAENWTVAYQSRSGDPREAWLEPDVKTVIECVDARKYSGVMVIPVGFLCDNVEVIFDLDVEVKEHCRARSLAYTRARTVTDHPRFIEMMGRRILEKC